MSRKILCGAACNLDKHQLQALLPLFQDGEIEVIEWSFDSIRDVSKIPVWYSELLQLFGDEKRLLGHGVYFSLFSGKWKAEHQSWLNTLNQLCQKYTFNHISEHFGYMTGKHFHEGAPLPVPLTSITLEIGRDRLYRIAESCKRPVGLENLAYAFHADHVKRYGEFMADLLEPVNGFLILDIHNIYCQSKNFNINFNEILHAYPLHLVREIHISGGSWEADRVKFENRIRRDTHDEAVPEEVFEMLEVTLPVCPHVEFVIFEQMGSALRSPLEVQKFHQDYGKFKNIVKAHCQVRSFHPLSFHPDSSPVLGQPIENDRLYEEQQLLSEILETSPSWQEAQTRILSSALNSSDWEANKWDPSMLATAVDIAQKWKHGF